MNWLFDVLILVLMEYGLWHFYSLYLWWWYGCLNPCSNGIWSLTLWKGHFSEVSKDVLILVLMEYGLWHKCNQCNSCRLHCLNPCSNGIWSLTQNYHGRKITRIGLNPCSNGIWSLTYEADVPADAIPEGLNPCSNGIWSLTQRHYQQLQLQHVLILVLMEYGLWRLNLMI